MWQGKLANLVWRHNAVQLLVAVCGAIAAAVLWVISFELARWIFTFAVGFCGDCGLVDAQFDPWPLSFSVACGVMVLLALDGIRRHGRSFGLDAYCDSSFSDFGDDPRINHIAGGLWFILQILLLAPHTTMAAIGAWRKRVRPGPQSIEQAEFILEKLEAARRWVSPLEFGDCAAAVRLLHRLNLIWVGNKDGEFKIRFPAGMEKGKVAG